MERMDGKTPLEADELDELLIRDINTREELNEYEQRNIEKAIVWTMGRTFSADQLLNDGFIRRLHKLMYGKVWSWAGKYRKTNKNIGIEKHLISQELRMAIDDCKFHIKNDSFPPDEISIRFKHRLVSIHCFPNGNGRHSRLMADLIIEHVFNLPVFSWGAANLSGNNDVRKSYLHSIRKADQGEFSELVQFARS